MRIVKARIGRKRKSGTAFTLDSSHPLVVSGLYHVSRQGETYVCLVNETSPDKVIIAVEELLGEHVPVNSKDMITPGELLMVKPPLPERPSHPTPERVQLIKETIQVQGHLSSLQQEQLREVLLRHHGAVSLRKSDMGRSSAVPHVLRPKTEEPAYVKQFKIPAAHLHFINEQIYKLLLLGAMKEDWVNPHKSPVFAVNKPHSEELRFVIDMRMVNSVIWDDFHRFVDVTS